ncbi:hypothetical protein [Rhodoligotrophos defluvii]|uniref:hypothetical protein n=1 Tax=Rhodoligotrophos defluvii TaxID=2561934 RepID=UPI0010CA12A8|nr:hypothetical protein [Rhodoligotrophos defluvii]
MTRFTGVTNSQPAKVFFYRISLAGFYGLHHEKYGTVLEACDAALSAMADDAQIAAKVWVEGARMFEQEEIPELRRVVRND